MKQAYTFNDNIRSLRDEKIAGPIVGFGTIQWDDTEQPQLVYLVQIAQGSSSLGPAVAVLRADQVKGRWED